MSEDTLKQKTAKGLFWGGISNGVQQLLGGLFGIYLARTLSADDYGLVGMLAIFTGIASTIINSGFSVALTNKRDATHEDYNAVFWFTVIVGLLCYIILFFSAPVIANFYGRSELVTLSRIIFISFFVSGISTVSYTVMFKQLMVKQQAQIDVTAMFASGFLGVLLAFNGFGYWALALQGVTFIVVGCLLRFIISPWKPTCDFDFRPLKGMFSFSVKLFFTNIFQQINANIFSVILGRFYNATQVGYYDQGKKWAGMGHQLIVGMISSVSQPVFANVIQEKERQRNILGKLMRFGAFVSFPSFLGLAFVANEFIVITVGEKWIPSIPFLQLFCLWGAIAFIWNLYTNLLLAHGKSNIYLWGHVFIGILQLASVILFSPFGILAMVRGYIFSYFIGILYWHYYVSQQINFSGWDFLKNIAPYLGVAVFSIGITYFLTNSISNHYYSFFLKMILTATIYIVMIYALGSKIIREAIDMVKNR